MANDNKSIMDELTVFGDKSKAGSDILEQLLSMAESFSSRGYRMGRKGFHQKQGDDEARAQALDATYQALSGETGTEYDEALQAYGGEWQGEPGGRTQAPYRPGNILDVIRALSSLSGKKQ